MVSITGTRSEGCYDNDFGGMQFHSLNIQDAVAISELATKFESLDVLVNCIGSVLWKKAEFEREGFEKIININLTGAMQLCTKFFPLLEASQGNIVNLDSIVAIRPAPANTINVGLMGTSKSLIMLSQNSRYMRMYPRSWSGMCFTKSSLISPAHSSKSMNDPSCLQSRSA